MRRYYIYRHIRNDSGIPFYIGIGSKRENIQFRTFKQEFERAHKYNSGHRSSYWMNVFNQCGRNILIEILYECDSYSEIKEKEKEFIALYGRRDNNTGILVNLTDGGEGVQIHRSDEWRLKQRLAKLGKKQSHELVAKRMAGRKGYKHSTDTIAKIRLKNTGKRYVGVKRTEEQKLKLSLDRKGISMGWSQDIVTRQTTRIYGKK